MTIETLTGRQLSRLGLDRQPDGPVKQCCCSHETGACGNFFRSQYNRNDFRSDYLRQHHEFCYFCMVTRPFCREKISRIKKEAEWLITPALPRGTSRTEWAVDLLIQWYLGAEQDAAGKSPRCGDADRDDCIALLREAAAQGHLSMDEFSDRMDKAMAAVYQADLDLLRSDLPDLRPPAVPEPEPELVPWWSLSRQISVPLLPLLILVICAFGLIVFG